MRHGALHCKPRFAAADFLTEAAGRGLFCTACGGFPAMPIIASNPRNPHSPVVFALFLGVTCLIASEFIPISLLTPMAASLGLSVGTAGQTVTAVGAAAALASLFVGALFPHADRRRLFLGYTLLLVLSNALIALSQSAPLLFAARALLGFAVGGFWSMSSAAAQRTVHPLKLPAAFALIYSGVSIATILALPGASWVESEFGWRAVFWAAAAASAAAFVWQLLTFPSMPAVQAAGLRTMGRLLRRGAVLSGLAATLTTYFGCHVVFTYLRAILEKSLAPSANAMSLILLVYALVNIAGTFAAARFFRRDLGRAFTVLYISGALAAGALYLCRGGEAILAPALIWGFLFGFVPVGWALWLVRALPKESEAAGGLTVAVTQLAIGLAASVGGRLMDAFGPEPLFFAAMAGELATLAAARRTMKCLTADEAREAASKPAEHSGSSPAPEQRTAFAAER